MMFILAMTHHTIIFAFAATNQKLDLTTSNLEENVQIVQTLALIILIQLIYI